MKVARYYTRQDIRVEDVPMPEIGPGELLIQTKACGLCGSDLMEWYVQKKAPEVLGHEPAGVVAKVGAGVTQFKVGDRVFVHHHVPCFICHHCVRGHYTLCDTFKATHLDPGGFAEYFRVPALNVERDVLKLPAEMSFEQGTQIEPLATCIRGIERAGIQAGDTVLILGAGVTGLMNMQLANIYGAGKVIVTDFAPFRLEMARRLGADHALEAREDIGTALKDLNAGRLADVVIVTAGSIKAMAQALSLAGGGSTVLLFAPSSPGENLAVSPFQLLFSEITLVSTYSCTHIETRQALKLIHGGRVKVEELITHRFDLTGVGQAINLAALAGESMKILIIPS
ncbi:MAG: zinc-dependent dehydrogenase [Anaerolineae bacterium]|nr:zinc-dependent dehydrogenase [Anaerolineae bacterium]